MSEEEKLELATKVAPSYQCSIQRVVEIIEEIISSSRMWTLDFKVDEEYLNKVMWFKTVTGQL